MKKTTLVIMTICLILTGFKSNAADNSKILGSWKITVADAPYEYSSSTIIVTETTGKLDVKILFADGQSVSAGNPTFTNDVLKFSVNLEGYNNIFSGKVADLSLTGSVDTPDGVLSVKGEKITIIGLWDYSAPDAPYEYSTGKIQFTEVNGKYTGKVIAADGTQIPVKSLKIENNAFSFGVEIDYETVTVTGQLVNGRITGKADSPDGVLPITAVRSKMK